MNANDEILDLLIKRDLLLQRVGNGLSKDVASQYIKMIDEAINSLGKVDVSLINMNKIIKEINSRIEFNYEEQLANKFQELGAAEAAYVPKAINGLIGVNIVDKLLPEPLIERIINNSYLADGLTIAESFEKLNDNLKNTFQSQIRLSVLNGDTNQQIIKTLKPILNEFTTNKIDSLVKTAVSTVANNTRMEIYSENSDIFKGYQHQSVMDSRVTLQCAVVDGAFYDLNFKGINEKGKKHPYKPVPRHFRCRSIILPILKTFRELGIDLDEVTGLTRSSIDGELPRETNFDKWFSSKDKAFQESYLGKGRFELYKDGKITLSDLVNQKGETLAIKDLNKVSGVVKAVNVPKISFGYDGKFDKYVENIRDEAKIVIDKLPKPNEIVDVDNIGSYYSAGTIANGRATNTSATFLHEYGHFIDDTLGKNNIYKSSENSFKDALVKDALNHLDNNGTFKNNNLIRFVEDLYEARLVNGKYRTAITKNENSGMIADIADAMSGGRVSELKALHSKKIYAGHGIDYYGGKILHRSRTETFANMFSVWSQNDLESIENIKKIAPNTYKEFENIISNIVQSR